MEKKIKSKSRVNKEKTFRHYFPLKIFKRPVKIVLVGVGGNGSNVLTDLARIHYSLTKIGRTGLDVCAFDDDIVTDANCGRQLFSPAEIGRNKARTLISRVNNFFGLSWRAEPEKFNSSMLKDAFDSKEGILITCVDSAKERIKIFKGVHKCKEQIIIYNLDVGNNFDSGQVILGTLKGQVPQPDITRNVDTINYLPTVIDLYPDIESYDTVKTPAPSCSVQEALTVQDLFINRIMGAYATKLLWEGFKKYFVDFHGIFVNLKDLQTRALKVSPEGWKKMGFLYSDENKRKNGII